MNQAFPANNQLGSVVAEIVTRLKGLTLPEAKLLAQAAQQKAAELNVAIVFAAVDPGGNLLLLERMEEALLGGIELASAKAYSAVAFRMTTDALGRQAQPGQPLFGIQGSSKEQIVLFGGGYPCWRDRQLIGGIGISGGTVEEDMEIASFALQKYLEKSGNCIEGGKSVK